MSSNPDTSEIELQHERRLSTLEETELRNALQEAQTRIEKLEAENAALAEKAKLAVIDPLTKAFNRSGLEERLTVIQQEMQENPDAFKNKTIYFIFCDIDKFKEVNDTYGHDAGDRVLIEVVKLLQRSIRQYDTVCRYGGEELVIAMLDTSLEETEQKAEQLRAILAKTPIELTDGQKISVTASFGVGTLIETADKAVYEAKRSGRNQVRAYKDEDQTE